MKVRGFRIELGEVEAALRAHPAVADAVVVAQDQRLVAYICAQAGADAGGEILRGHLQGLLPDYMVPALFVGLPTLPLHSERQGRPQGAAEGGSRAGARRFPLRRPRRRRLVARAFAEVLGMPRVGLHTSFFALGGHSLMAMRQSRD